MPPSTAAVDRAPPAPFQRTVWWSLAAIALILLGGAAFVVDCRLALWSLEGRWPRLVRELLTVSESFGHGMGVFLILVTLGVLDPSRRWALPRVAALSLGAGILANVIKLLIVRTRPRAFGFEGDVWTTFGSWFPLASAGSGGQSFPSGHTATAVGLAIALSWLYPRGRYLFAVLAVLVALQRIQSGSHYLSDTLVSAGLAIILGLALFHVGPAGRWFARREARWRGRWRVRQAEKSGEDRRGGEERHRRAFEIGEPRRKIA